MRRSWKATAIAVAGAAALASGAYAIGTQAGGGSADAKDAAKDAGPPFGARAGAPFDDLANALGVSGDELRAALDDYRKQRLDDHEDDFAKALADALGKDANDVERALDAQRDAARLDFAKRLADALGKDVDEVRAALDKVKPDPSHGPRSFFDDLAKELGVSTDRLEQALRDARPHRLPPRQPFSGLAKELGVTSAQLRDALREVWRDQRPDFDNRQRELAQFLADRFHLSVDKVEKALDDAFPFGAGRGQCGSLPHPPGAPGMQWGGPPAGGPWGGP